ncbi:hypothetical protein RRF57_009624 [Xylaria bambusicola]|uniref:Uncharacterized protein n=1 Tax=Xylaria bambusicola TaxID=326684 RepID=A0AAN7UJX9_9PEZI
MGFAVPGDFLTRNAITVGTPNTSFAFKFLSFPHLNVPLTVLEGFFAGSPGRLTMGSRDCNEYTFLPDGNSTESMNHSNTLEAMTCHNVLAEG